VSEGTVILLASNSPRRRELIALGNWSFRVSVPDVDESQLPGESPASYVLRLAEAKAGASLSEAGDAQVIVAADTAVVYDGTIFGKPRDPADAGQMLKRLRAHTHQVYTGLAVIKTSTGKLLTDLCVTDVPMRNFTDAEIEAYVQTGDPLDKAGAYAIQHPQFHPVKSMSGCYASVMGLPMCHLMRVLAQMDISPNANIPANCQMSLHYQCPVSAAILREAPQGVAESRSDN
jgi:septum formation protein